jgi:hypothetical protein
VAQAKPILAGVGQFDGWIKASRFSLALSRCPFRLDFDSSPATGCVIEKAASGEILGALAQSLLHRLAMNVVWLLYKLRMIAECPTQAQKRA